MAGESKVAIEVSGQLGPRAVEVVVVSCPDGGGAVGHFADAAEVVAGVVIVPGIGAADAFFTLAVVLALDGVAGGVALLGDVGAVPNPALGEAAVELFRYPAGQSVIDEFVNARALGDLDEAVFGIPLISAQAVAEGVAIAIISEGAGGAAGDADAPALGGGVGRGGVVGGLDGEDVGAGNNADPRLIEVFRWRGGGGGLTVYLHDCGFIGRATD